MRDFRPEMKDFKHGHLNKIMIENILNMIILQN